MEYIRRREASLVNGHSGSSPKPSVAERLRSIDSAMTWIRGELVSFEYSCIQ